MRKQFTYFRSAWSRSHLPLAIMYLPFSATLAWGSNCPKKTDPKSVILFLNLNGAYEELKGAQAAACELGETLVVLPPVVQKDQDNLERAASKLQLLKDQLDACNNAKPPCAQKKNLSQSLNESTVAIRKMAQDLGAHFEQDSLRQKLEDLAGAGAAIKTIAISGHDGGNAYEGTQGFFTKKKLFESMANSYSNKPELMGRLESMLLWGCYTTTKSEVVDFKAHFPSLRLISGFYGRGPLSLEASSRNLMHDILVREKQVVRSQDASHVKAALRLLADLNNTNFGIYVHTCADANLFAYRDIAPGAPVVDGFEQFNDVETCGTEALEKRKLFERYANGELDLPSNTDQGPLRDIYTFARHNPKCAEQFNFPAERAGLMLFSEDVKKNFVHSFATQIQEAKQELDGLNDQKLLELLAANLRKKQDYMRAEVERMGPEEAAGKEYFQHEIEKIENEIQNLSSSEKFKDAIKAVEEMRTVRPLLDHIDSNNRIEILAATNKLFWAKIVDLPALDKITELMTKYLVWMQPKCMEFLDWYQYIPTQTARPRC